jgi:hypothetical protein
MTWPDGSSAGSGCDIARSLEPTERAKGDTPVSANSVAASPAYTKEPLSRLRFVTQYLVAGDGFEPPTFGL